MKHYLFLISIATLAIINSCKKECRKPEDVPVTKIEQEMYDWIVFKPGSYWIYIDSISGVYDSVYVTNVLLDTSLFINEKKCVEQRNEQIHVFMKSYYQGWEIRLVGQYNAGVPNSINQIPGMASIFDQNHSGGDGGHSHYMYFPVLQGTVGQWAFGWTFIRHDTIYSEIEVLGKTYQNVLRVHDNYNMALGYNTKFYHVKNIGVIRKEYYEIDRDNPNPRLLHVWELADYKVTQ